MRDADRAGTAAEVAARAHAVSGPAARPEGEPHLTFEILLADTLHEMTVDEEAGEPSADALSVLCDDTIAAMRASGSAQLVRPFHHSYLTPVATPVFPSRLSRLDVRS